MSNTITITGNLTKDVDFRYTNGGKAVANFTLADNGFENGEKTVIFWDCFMFGEQAEHLANNSSKGKEITVRGEAVPNEYEKDGVKYRNIRIKCGCYKNGRPSKAEREAKQAEKAVEKPF